MFVPDWSLTSVFIAIVFLLVCLAIYVYVVIVPKKPKALMYSMDPPEGMEIIQALTGIQCAFLKPHQGTIMYAVVQRLPALVVGHATTPHYVFNVRIKGRFHFDKNIPLGFSTIQIQYGLSHVPFTTFEENIVGEMVMEKIIVPVLGNITYQHDVKKRILSLTIPHSLIPKNLRAKGTPYFFLNVDVQDEANCSGCVSTAGVTNAQGTRCYEFEGNAYASPCHGNTSHCCCQGSGGADCIYCGAGTGLGSEINCSCTECGLVPA